VAKVETSVEQQAALGFVFQKLSFMGQKSTFLATKFAISVIFRWYLCKKTFMHYL